MIQKPGERQRRKYPDCEAKEDEIGVPPPRIADMGEAHAKRLCSYENGLGCEGPFMR